LVPTDIRCREGRVSASLGGPSSAPPLYCANMFDDDAARANEALRRHLGLGISAAVDELVLDLK
jgi:hypothetical protein